MSKSASHETSALLDAMPAHHDVRHADVNQRRLGAVLALAHEREVSDFASFLLLEQLGPRTLRSLALVAEVVHGAPTRLADPARFAFAHGWKDGHHFPVPLKVYDESPSGPPFPPPPLFLHGHAARVGARLQ